MCETIPEVPEVVLLTVVIGVVTVVAAVVTIAAVVNEVVFDMPPVSEIFNLSSSDCDCSEIQLRTSV